MKNKIFLLLLVFVTLLVITGCDKKGEKIESGKKDKEEDSNKLDNLREVKINCNEILNIVDINNYQNLFITNDGSLFQISYEKIFSNGTNCKQIESDKKFIRFIKAGILDSNNDIYFYNDNNEVVLYNTSMWSTITPNTMVEKINKDEYKNIIYSENDSKYGDNQIYYFYYNQDKKEIYSYLGENLEMSKDPIFVLDNDEEVVYITYGGIKTNKDFYVYDRRAKNKEECEKYADIKCYMQNGFYSISNTNIKKQLNKIKFIQIFDNYYFILDNNGNIYTTLLGG